MNSTFKTPKSVKQADAYLSQALKQIQSGKTSYSDEIQGMMDKIMKRDKFSYDADTDPLFQQALASAMSSGKTAMQDTIGQASALTGGYGSSYATTAGNQAYNAFIEDAYSQLPQYYQMAMEAHLAEGDEMYRQLGMFTDADDREYSRLLNAYDATFQHRNRAYDEAYGIFRDTKSDAFSLANFQLNEHNQMVSDAFNLYNATAGYADTMYDRSYQEWSDSINMALQQFRLQQSGAIANRDFNYQQDRDAVTDAWTQKQFDYQKERDAVGDSQYQQQFDFQKETWQKEFDETKRVNDAQIANMRKSGGSGGSGGSVSATSKIPSQISSAASKFKTDDERADYLNSMVQSGYITEEQADYLYEANISNAQKPFNERTWSKVDSGGWNWGGGIDKNAKVQDQYNNEYTLGDLWDEASKSMGKDEAENWIIKLQKNLGLTWW